MDNDSVCSRAHPPHPPSARERATGEGACACADEPKSIDLTLIPLRHPMPWDHRLAGLLKVSLRVFGFKAEWRQSPVRQDVEVF